MRHWILFIAFCVGAILSLSNLFKSKKSIQTSSDFTSLKREYNITMLLLFVALASIQIEEISKL